MKPRGAYCETSFSVSIALMPFSLLNTGFMFSSNQPSPIAFRYQCVSFMAASTGFKVRIVPERCGLLSCAA